VGRSEEKRLNKLVNKKQQENDDDADEKKGEKKLLLGDIEIAKKES
jgi:hypothetical protein